MQYESIQNYVLPVVRVLIPVIAAGVILRCVSIALNSKDEEDFWSVLKRMGKKIAAAILAICASEMINVIASLYK